jgi:hypothetical protein
MQYRIHPTGETAMFRKFAIAAVVALGTASLAVTATPAAAKGGKGFHHHHHGFHGVRVYSGGLLAYNSCLRTRWVVNRYGELVRRVINVCDF